MGTPSYEVHRFTREPPTNQNRIVGAIRFTFTTLLIFGFAAGGALALVRPSSLVSLQSIWTLLIFGILLVLCAAYWVALTPTSKALVTFACSIVAVAAVQTTVVEPPLNYAGYVVSGAAFLLGAALAWSRPDLALGIRPFFWSAVFVSVIGIILMPAGLAGDHRILQMTTAFAAIVIVARLWLQECTVWIQLVGVAAIAIASTLAYQDAARTASLVLTLASVSFLIFGRGTYLWLRLALVGFQLGVIAVVYVATDHMERWLGGDSGLTVAGTSLNTNGRIEMWSQALSSTTPSADTGWMLTLVGQGVGSSSISSMAVNNLPAPLNEFVRHYVDFGLVGLLVLLTVLAVLIVGGVRLFLSQDSRPAGLIVLLTVAGYTAFSFSESMVAYSWVLVPTGMLVVGLLRKHGLRDAST